MPTRAVYLTADAAQRLALARFLRVRRAELGLTRLELADRAGLSLAFIGEYEHAATAPRWVPRCGSSGLRVPYGVLVALACGAPAAGHE
jgi:transcriptional regulator with XRE-family HTH domain